mmetsp:Transcript_49649/g.80524  ORF Transcript_49649/g.80524 Transcript_49649/m.80524 type:complete len:81 (-) Transcript_49649:137-379(-)
MITHLSPSTKVLTQVSGSRSMGICKEATKAHRRHNNNNITRKEKTHDKARQETLVLHLAITIGGLTPHHYDCRTCSLPLR